MSERIYYTHDNCGRPFKVVVKDKTIDIYKCVADDTYDGLVYNVPSYEKIFIGKDKHAKNDGNSILVKLANTYLYIGSRIYTFNPPDEIQEYKSPIHGSDVSYAYAIGLMNTYLLAEKVYIPNSEITTDDPYDHYYGLKKNKKKLVQNFIKTMVHERLWN